MSEIIHCVCSQLETVEYVLKECPLHSTERDFLIKSYLRALYKGRPWSSS